MDAFGCSEKLVDDVQLGAGVDLWQPKKQVPYS